VDGVFDALGDPVRRRILEVLAAGEQPAGRVVDAVRSRGHISQPAVSQHLRVLREAGLVRVRAEGTRRLYTVDPDGLAAARAWLERLADPLDQFAQPLDALATELARGRRASRLAPAAAPSTSVTGDQESGSGARGGRLA
jgi:DNA-binding transcriptional ArsR family regulator